MRKWLFWFTIGLFAVWIGCFMAMVSFELLHVLVIPWIKSLVSQPTLWAY